MPSLSIAQTSPVGACRKRGSAGIVTEKREKIMNMQKKTMKLKRANTDFGLA